jgi:hypothetical protein
MKVTERKNVPVLGLIVLIALCVFPQLVEARVFNIWPDRLQPTQSDYGYRRQLDFVSGLNGNCFFTAEVKLPVGTTITRLQYFHRGFTNANTSVVLFRVKMGQVEQLMTFATSTQSDGSIVPVNDPGAVGNPLVAAGYRYYVRVFCANENSTVRGVRVFYIK